VYVATGLVVGCSQERRSTAWARISGSPSSLGVPAHADDSRAPPTRVSGHRRRRGHRRLTRVVGQPRRRSALLAAGGVRCFPAHRACLAPELSAHCGDEWLRFSDVAPVKIGVPADEPPSVLWPPEVGCLAERPVRTLDLRCGGDRATDQEVATVGQVERGEGAQGGSGRLVPSSVVLAKALTFAVDLAVFLVVPRRGGGDPAWTEQGLRCSDERAPRLRQDFRMRRPARG
jgi:hypothetical protein